MGLDFHIIRQKYVDLLEKMEPFPTGWWSRGFGNEEKSGEMSDEDEEE